MPLLNDVDFQNLCKELLRSGEISSDGELSEIAKQEISKQNTANVEMASDFVKQNFATWIKEEPCLIIQPQNPTTASNPSTENYPGPLGFDVRVEQTGTKSKEAHFSEALKKIYINQNRFVNIEFRLNNLLADSSPISGDLFIRTLCIFCSANDFVEPVRVCYTHSRDSSGNLKSEVSEHLVRCSHPSSIYHEDSLSRRHSVIAPFPELQSGSKCSILAFKFMDLGSCSGGLNRRETALIFTLEDNLGKVIGRRVLQLRICTCPKRDYEQDEKNREKQLGKNPIFKNRNNAVTGSENIVQAGKRKAFWVLAYGEENYAALKSIGETLEKKDGGDVQLYNEAMTRFNSLDQPTKKCKKEF